MLLNYWKYLEKIPWLWNGKTWPNSYWCAILIGNWLDIYSSNVSKAEENDCWKKKILCKSSFRNLSHKTTIESNIYCQKNDCFPYFKLTILCTFVSRVHSEAFHMTNRFPELSQSAWRWNQTWGLNDKTNDHGLSEVFNQMGVQASF